MLLVVPEDVRAIYRRTQLSLEIMPFDRQRLHGETLYRREIARSVGAENFDWLILPAFNLDKATLKLSRQIPAKRRISFLGEMRGVRFWHRWLQLRRIREKIPLPGPDLHELEKYRILLRHLGLKPEIDLPRIPRDENGGPRKPKAETKNPQIVLAVNTVNAIKQYPHWAEVVKLLHENVKPHWVLIGGPGETIPPALQAALPPEATSDLRGKTTLESLVEEIADSDLFLGVDTGPAHLALALQKPTVVVLGGGDHGRFFPYGQARVVTHPMACFQCHWECKYERALCLHDLSPKAVVREVLEALKKPA